MCLCVRIQFRYLKCIVYSNVVFVKLRWGESACTPEYNSGTSSIYIVFSNVIFVKLRWGECACASEHNSGTSSI